MLEIIVQAAIPIKEIDDTIIALTFLVVLFLGSFRFHLGSVLKITKLE